MIIFFAAVLLQTLCFAQDGLENLPPPPKEKPKEADLLHALNTLSDESHSFSDPTKQSNDDQRVDAILIRVAQRASKIKSMAVIDAIIAFPEKSAGIIAAKVHALGIFEDLKCTPEAGHEIQEVLYWVRCRRGAFHVTFTSSVQPGV
jgi:hypothetical protein